MKNYQDGGEAILEAFRNMGIDYVMASPGSEWGALWEAFARQQVDKTPGPTYLSCAHETLAVDLALGYTQFTGKMQACMLHTGVGLLQGSVGIDAAQRANIPMVVISGESLSYGEKQGFDPGPQWLTSLSVVGGTHRLVEPIVKWSQQISSPHTLYEQLTRAGEMAQRTPSGPTYVCVPIETMLADWARPDTLRKTPPVPKLQAADSDIERAASILASAKNPMIVTEDVGRDPAAYAAFRKLVDTLQIPVMEGQWANYANLAKDHPMHQGVAAPARMQDADVVLVVRARAPWYPPSSRPAKATVIVIDEAPYRLSMVYQSIQADMSLEGDVASSLTLLLEAVQGAVKNGAAKERGAKWAAAHKKLWDEYTAAQTAAAKKTSPMDPITLCKTLSDTLPHDTIYVDETIVHKGTILRHLNNQGPQSYFRVQGGLGQGLGVSLGHKIANPKRPVVTVIGDGSFMYNPVAQSLALGKHEELPTMTVIFNNSGYQAMRKEHEAYYPDGVAAAHKIFYGEPVTDFEYSELAKPFGGYGKRVETQAALKIALKEGMAAVNDGKTAVINAMIEKPA
ncbi:MAG TPA: thiamine pyrophosphate-dependent enzyme [Alphaproteobacteria bacterium]